MRLEWSYLSGIVVGEMELRHLRYFIAVAEEENVTRAAARLHLSQPPLTRQIHDLEAELGVALFDRRGKTIRLTEAGQVFLLEAKASLQRVDEAVRAVRAAASGAHGDLHLGYAPTPTMEILPELLKAFRTRLPTVRVLLHDLGSPEMLAGLREGRLHAALMMEPSKQAGRGIAFAALRSYPVGVAVAANHPFARRRKVTLEAFREEAIIAYSRKDYPDYHEFLARRLGPISKKLNIVEECDSGASLAAAVGSGKGICVCPSIFAEQAATRLRFVPIDPPPVRAAVGIAHRTPRSSSTIGTLVEIARALAS
jgi:DNA-binding transcriptional LysR family regulator